MNPLDPALCMSTQEKTLEKLKKKPTPTDIRWTAVQSALEGLGYDLLNGNGSRRKFIHKDTKHVISLHEPHPQPTLKAYAVEYVRDELINQGLI